MSSQTVSAQTESAVESRECPAHGRYDARVIRVLDRAAFAGSCPQCAEERAAAEAERERQQQAMEREARISRLFHRSGIPRRFKDRTLDNYQVECDGQRRALGIARSMAGGDREDGVSLVFCGRPGTGKTHLACGVARAWIDSGRPALFCAVLSAIRTIKSTYGAGAEVTEAEAVRTLTEVDLLVLDEVGAQLGTEHEKVLLFEIINERYQQMRSTILISNLTRAELLDYLGERVMDRFREGGAVVAFAWESYRGSKRKT